MKYASEILTPAGLQYGTGYFGNATIKKMNSLYGCDSSSKVIPITTAATRAATSITSTSATLNGTVNPHGNNVMYRFGYNLAGAAVPTYTAWSASFTGTSNVSANANITGLTPGTTYYYFINVYNSITGSFAPNGLTESFTTSSI